MSMKEEFVSLGQEVIITNMGRWWRMRLICGRQIAS